MTSENKTLFKIKDIREDFPILDQSINGAPLIYLDNAASTQKPKSVINTISSYYENDHSNVHRGVHSLSVRATELYENSRNKVVSFINATNSNEIIFTKGTTDSINLVASSLTNTISKTDEIVITTMEHHSNIVPWQELCKKTGATLKIAPIDHNGELIIEELSKLLNKNTKILALTHISNTLGTINPIKKIIAIAHDFEIKVLIDGAQAIGHQHIDVQDLDCDYYAFSGHKLYGPTGIGVLYGKEKLLNKLEPYQFGGEMILKVTFDETTYNTLPYKFEAGTPNIAGAIGLGAAIDYLETINLNACIQQEKSITEYALKRLGEIPNIKLIGNSKNRSSIISFTINNIHPHDIGTILNQKGIALRTGHHCTMPLMDFYKIPGTIRASFAFYNTKSEIDQMINGLQTSYEMLS
ncbi:MAG: cysteine desulfurase [Gammaproteobacteria bacterium]|jgi:cysteine desulfurase/selenocysteine lyase|nr:cysteine desulfurase [Gammaproteobacteria bacterium]MBT5217291.1 cysteine desulfurase [Gammaproteobacteria bacterium]MBT5542602.1 cysteine desulfurase [Gammaproteobacteria bacterium]MBT6073837.1 cysteine desulfurase [Gammaproteobacteria bacterium]MDG2434194.1 cysteine desulfurase [Gammaproteobacteria bacterium]